MPDLQHLISIGLNNEMAIGLIAVAVISTLALLVGKLVRKVGVIALRQVSTTVFINGTDTNYTTFKIWLDKTNKAKNSRNLLLSNVFLVSSRAANSIRKNLLFSFGKGTHWVLLNGILTKLTFHLTELNNGELAESVSITLFTRSRDKISRLFHECQNEAQDDGCIRVFMYSGYWKTISGIKRRGIETYASEENISENILNDLNSFLNREDFYQNRGLPYRRGYLFYGKPGTGKTSLISVIASELKLPLYILPLGNIGCDKDLITAIAGVPSGAALVFEDIDTFSFCQTREPANDETEEDQANSTKISLSALLNAIDGLASGKKRIVIMTSNHPEKLDPALIRPGRIDVTSEIKPLSYEAVNKYLENFYDNIVSPDVPRDVSIPCSELQGICLQNDYLSAITKINELHSANQSGFLRRA